MWIVKIGGSLSTAETLPLWLDALNCYFRGQAVIVPGGGPFAELVHESQSFWKYGDADAHQMALLAMAQYGIMLTGLQPGLVPAASLADIHAALHRSAVPVWLPLTLVGEDPTIEQCWGVTSDSLAAWLAQRLGATRLILVKSITVGKPAVSVDELALNGIVDEAFPDYFRAAAVETVILSDDQYELLPQMLLAEASAGTHVVADGSGATPRTAAHSLT